MNIILESSFLWIKIQKKASHGLELATIWCQKASIFQLRQMQHMYSNVPNMVYIYTITGGAMAPLFPNEDPPLSLTFQNY
jgi:hypothetical protein